MVDGRDAAAAPASFTAITEVRVTMLIGRGGASVVLSVGGTAVYLTAASARRIARSLELHADELEPPPREASSG